MDLPNAFLGQKSPPSGEELAVQLGPAMDIWKELLVWLARQGVVQAEWKSVSPEYGWSLCPVLKKRTIAYLSPCQGCFRVAFVLGDRAVAAARTSGLSRDLLKQLAGARRYAEGTGLRITVRTARDLAPVRKLVEIKLQN